MPTLLNYLRRRLTGLFVLGMAFLIYLSTQFAAAPTEPRPDLGTVAKWNNHGTVHYISKEDRKYFDITFNSVVGLFFCVALVIGLQERYEKPRDGQ